MSACRKQHELAISAPVVEAEATTFSWHGEPARWVTVYRCAEACPPVATLPSYLEDNDPEPGEVFWSVSGVESPANGRGTIEQPLDYGDADHGQAQVETEPRTLIPGHYLIRIVTFNAVQLTVDIGTGWATFTVPATPTVE